MHKICDVCKKAPATIHLTDIHNNVKKEVHMCEACAEQKGIAFKHQTTIQQFLQTIQKQGGKSAPRERENEPACPDCGMTWSAFRAAGRFGCAKDYEVFRERLAPILDDIQAGERIHVGKHPRRDGEVAQRVREVADCRRRLREAVETEDYEEAARIRDRIASLSSSQDN